LIGTVGVNKKLIKVLYCTEPVPKPHLFCTLIVRVPDVSVLQRTLVNLGEPQCTELYHSKLHRTALYCCQKQVFLELLVAFQECARAIAQAQLTTQHRTAPNRAAAYHTTLNCTCCKLPCSIHRISPNLDSTSITPQPNRTEFLLTCY